MRMNLMLAGVLLLTACSYRAVWSAGWVYEDANAVQANPSVTGQAPIAVDRARWLSALSHKLVYQVAGSDPRLPHLVNVGLHLTNGVLVYAVAGAFLSPIGALVAASLFLLHPIQTEAVAYVASRSELLATLFALLAFWLSLDAKGWLRLAAVVGCVALAVSAKESAVVVVPLMAITDAFRGRRLTWWRYGLLAVPVALMAETVIRFDYLSRSELSPLAYAATQATAIWRYLALAIVPIGQSVDHDFDLVAWPVRYLALLGIWALALIPMIGGLRSIDGDKPRGQDIYQLWDRLGSYRVVAFGVTWMLIALTPRFVMRIPEIVNEHQTYLPFVGLWLLIGALAHGWLTASDSGLQTTPAHRAA